MSDRPIFEMEAKRQRTVDHILTHISTEDICKIFRCSERLVHKTKRTFAEQGTVVRKEGSGGHKENWQLFEGPQGQDQG